MDEDRKPLGDLCPSSFYGAGLDANSYVTVNAGIEKPSGLSKEVDINAPTPKKASKKRVDVPTIRVSRETEVLKSSAAGQPHAEAEAEPQPESQTHKEATRPRTRQSASSRQTEASPAPSKKR
jgi:hypothetical protein